MNVRHYNMYDVRVLLQVTSRVLGRTHRLHLPNVCCDVSQVNKTTQPDQFFLRPQSTSSKVGRSTADYIHNIAGAMHTFLQLNTP